MLEYEAEVLIERTPNQVFPYLTDAESISHWAGEVIEVQQSTPDPVGVGTRFRERVQSPFGEAWVDWEITEYIPQKRCGFSSDSHVAEGQVTYQLKPTEEGTLLSAHVLGRLKGLLRLLTPIIKRRSLIQRRKDLSALKRFIEGNERRQQA